MDELLIGTKNHTQLLQYIPKEKHHKWGIKMWLLCDSIPKYCVGTKVQRTLKIKMQSRNIASLFSVCKLITNGELSQQFYHQFVDNFVH